MPIRKILENDDNGMYQDSSRQAEIEKSWSLWNCSDFELRDKTVKFVSYLKSIAKCKCINIDTMCVSFSNDEPSYPNKQCIDSMRIKDSTTCELLYIIMFRYENGEYVELLGPEDSFHEPIVSGSWNDIVKFFRSPIKKSKC
jgi:hypothetical protein